MPYVKLTSRTRLARKDGCNAPQDAGELNYKLAGLLDEYCENIGFKYQTANDIIGVLECLKHEFLRRFVDGYENLKRNENGEVFHFMSERIQEIQKEKTK